MLFGSMITKKKGFYQNGSIFGLEFLRIIETEEKK